MQIKGDSSPSSQNDADTLDGKDWSDWVSLTVNTTLINTPPTLTIPDKNLQGYNEWNLSKLVSYSDANGDAVSKYQIQADTGTQKLLDECGDATIDVGPIDMSGGNYEFTPVI